MSLYQDTTSLVSSIVNIVTSFSKGIDDENEKNTILTSALSRTQWKRRLNNCVILMTIKKKTQELCNWTNQTIKYEESNLRVGESPWKLNP